MPVNKYSVSLQPEIVSEINRREGERSTIINTSLDRYFAILSRARRSLAQIISDDEMALILDAINGIVHVDTISVQLVYAEIEDSLADGLAEKWSIDGPALVEKLRGLTYAENMALVDAGERWWKRVSDSENPTPGDALRK
jgi:hypothetical protein